MAELYNMGEVPQRLILVGVATSENDDTKESLEELAELVKTPGQKPWLWLFKTVKSLIRELILEKEKLKKYTLWCRNFRQTVLCVMTSFLLPR